MAVALRHHAVVRVPYEAIRPADGEQSALAAHAPRVPQLTRKDGAGATRPTDSAEERAKNIFSR